MRIKFSPIEGDRDHTCRQLENTETFNYQQSVVAELYRGGVDSSEQGHLVGVFVSTGPKSTPSLDSLWGSLWDTGEIPRSPVSDVGSFHVCVTDLFSTGKEKQGQSLEIFDDFACCRFAARATRHGGVPWLHIP